MSSGTWPLDSSRRPGSITRATLLCALRFTYKKCSESHFKQNGRFLISGFCLIFWNQPIISLYDYPHFIWSFCLNLLLKAATEKITVILVLCQDLLTKRWYRGRGRGFLCPKVEIIQFLAFLYTKILTHNLYHTMETNYLIYIVYTDYQ